MAKKFYVSDSGTSKLSKKWYVSVLSNGQWLSKEVKAAYCSVGGLSKLFFGSGGGDTNTGFWFYYDTVSGNMVEYRPVSLYPSTGTNNVTKTNNGMAFYAITIDSTGSCIFAISTNRDAVAYVDHVEEYTFNPTIVSVTIGNDVWYIAYRDLRPNAVASEATPNCLMQNSDFSSMTPTQIGTWIINNRIYTDDFSEAYQANQTYNLVKADMEKTIRKFLAVYIYKTSEYLPSYGYTNAYNLLYNNIDTVVNYFLQNKGNNTIIDLWTTDIYSTKSIRFGCAYSNSDLNNVEVSDVISFDGYSIVPCYDKEIAYSNTAVIDINGDGTITYESWSEPYEDYLVMGVNGENGFEYMHLSNVGLNFGGTGHSSNWVTKLWNGYTNLNAPYMWTDGTNIYFSVGSVQYVLNRATDTWTVKTWNGFSNISGERIWTDGSNYYYSEGTNQYILDKATSTWSSKTWYGFTNFDGHNIWSDGTNIYYSYNSTQYVLNKSTSTWSAKTWNGLTSFRSQGVWTDGNTYYYSYGSAQYVLNKSTSTWSAKTWSGLTNFYGINIWTDGDNVYYSGGSEQYVLNKSTSTWNTKVWTGMTSSSYYGSNIWKDGNNIYFSRGQNEQFVLE